MLALAAQGGHQLANEWHGIGVGGHIALLVIALALVWFILAMMMSGRR